MPASCSRDRSACRRRSNPRGVPGCRACRSCGHPRRPRGTPERPRPRRLPTGVASVHSPRHDATRAAVVGFLAITVGNPTIPVLPAAIESPPVRLSQIALSVSDVRRAQRWYREVLGLAPGGGTNLFAGPLSSMVQGVPRAASTCWWLVDRQDQFQVELFEFRSPLVRALPRDWRPSDVGYSTISFAVEDLDAVMERGRDCGTPPLTDPVGAAGGRRVCLRDPGGCPRGHPVGAGPGALPEFLRRRAGIAGRRGRGASPPRARGALGARQRAAGAPVPVG